MNTSELGQAIYDRLDDQLSGSYQGIYTDVPQPQDSGSDSDFPYLTIGPFTGTNSDTKDDNGATIVAQVHIWTRSRSALAWRALHDGVYDALQDYDLTVTGANVINCLYDGSEDFDDPDGKTTHVVLRFRIMYFLT